MIDAFDESCTCTARRFKDHGVDNHSRWSSTFVVLHLKAGLHISTDFTVEQDE